jgi:hypothetical protein
MTLSSIHGGEYTILFSAGVGGKAVEIPKTYNKFYHIKMFMGDQCSWILWVTHIYISIAPHKFFLISFSIFTNILPHLL